MVPTWIAKKYWDRKVERRRKSQLPERVQAVIIQQFVAGTKVRTAADLVGVNQLHTLSFHMLRELIARKLPELELRFSGVIESMKAGLAAPEKGSADAAGLAKFRCSTCLRKAASCTSLSYQMLDKINWFRLFEGQDSIAYADGFFELWCFGCPWIPTSSHQLFWEFRCRLKPYQRHRELPDKVTCHLRRFMAFTENTSISLLSRMEVNVFDKKFNAL